MSVSSQSLCRMYRAIHKSSAPNLSTTAFAQQLTSARPKSATLSCVASLSSKRRSRCWAYLKLPLSRCNLEQGEVMRTACRTICSDPCGAMKLCGPEAAAGSSLHVENGWAIGGLLIGSYRFFSHGLAQAGKPDLEPAIGSGWRRGTGFR